MNTQWKLVPVDPTREMLVAALKTNGACPTYAAMLSASPTPPAAFAPPVAWLDPDSIQHGEILSAQAKKNSEFLGQQARARRFSVPLYAHPDAGEIARLTAENAALQQRLNAADQRIDELERDKQRLDALESNCWDVRFNSSPNGDAGDSSINIEVIGHWMDKPFERVIGENYSENLRAAIDQAIAAPAYPPARPEYPELEELVERDHQIPSTSGMRLNMLANQGE